MELTSYLTDEATLTLFCWIASLFLPIFGAAQEGAIAGRFQPKLAHYCNICQLADWKALADSLG